MPRKALYDLQAVLTQAIDVLLEHGYHGAIMDEIIARTDFNRRGFYLEFGSKQQFLYQVLDHYLHTQLDPIVGLLEQNQGLVSVHDFFDAYVRHVRGRGCLLINMITEMGFDDEAVRDRGRHYLDRLQIAFIGCLEKAQRHQQVRADINLESTALQLTSYVQGFAVNAVLAGDTDELSLATRALLGPLATE
ncbi:TetR/AcrR family transcriptional regulator [Aestuariibacter halophilus]|uniref:TetR/AcrR family transcriptional regulator n=1 Tax=Fluctibacter halophilus TaxID=226011 RepID=A0ABS8GA83_9ALTE|nr:TetR/AcrR family transcriptional regulator [Aestuariibacter halophilus]MCC2617500.1 TetR/AcrR family transcriptional regulator [Aestuariibacter halophilus]